MVDRAADDGSTPGLVRAIEPLIPGLRRYATALVRDASTADDLVQDCLERVVGGWNRRRDDAAVTAWVFTILRNLALLHALVDDVLVPERTADVLRYLQAHPDVAERVDSYRRQRDALRARLAPIAEAPLPPELNIRTIAQRRGRASTPRWPTALAASVLLSLGMAGGWLLHDTVRPLATGLTALADEAESGFRVYASDMERPVELRAVDQSQLTRWMSNRLDYAVSAPDLSASGYRFMGGRLLATVHGPAALFMYDDDRGTRLVMVSRPMAHERNSRMRSITRDQSSSIVWSDRGIGYGLVGRLDSQRLRQLADEAKRQLTGPGMPSGPA